MTAYELEFTSHDEETMEKILAHYRKSLKRGVAALSKEWVDMYFTHEEIDHPCRPTDLRWDLMIVAFLMEFKGNFNKANTYKSRARLICNKFIT